MAEIPIDDRLITISKLLSKHLRHAPEALGLTLRGRRIGAGGLIADCPRHSRYVVQLLLFRNLLADRQVVHDSHDARDMAAAFETEPLFVRRPDFPSKCNAGPEYCDANPLQVRDSVSEISCDSPFEVVAVGHVGCCESSRNEREFLFARRIHLVVFRCQKSPSDGGDRTSRGCRSPFVAAYLMQRFQIVIRWQVTLDVIETRCSVVEPLGDDILISTRIHSVFSSDFASFAASDPANSLTISRSRRLAICRFPF